MSGKELVFRPIEFRPWQGRYSRIVGKTTTFKIRNTSENGLWPVIEWEHQEGRVTCLAVNFGDVRQLADAVAEAKRKLYGNFTGSFVINEFGQVIVPSSAGDGTRLLVGETEGVMLFDNPLTNGILDLSDDEGLNNGDPWDKPYIGIQYNLTSGSNIYIWRKDKGEYLPRNYRDLVAKLRSVRRTGPVRFVVNPYGIVLTKAPVGDYNPDEDLWQPVYVGRINRNSWFEKEE
jgi:hypothetical protein